LGGRADLFRLPPLQWRGKMADKSAASEGKNGNSVGFIDTVVPKIKDNRGRKKV
jgi:hypothetical protein